MMEREFRSKVERCKLLCADGCKTGRVFESQIGNNRVNRGRARRRRIRWPESSNQKEKGTVQR